MHYIKYRGCNGYSEHSDGACDRRGERNTSFHDVLLIAREWKNKG